MKPLKDAGYGITQMSLKYWRSHKHLIGEVTAISCKSEDVQSKWNTIVEGTKGEMHLSGFNCGYNGEGPHGLWTLCQEAGFKRVTMDRISSTNIFTISRVSSQ